MTCKPLESKGYIGCRSPGPASEILIRHVERARKLCLFLTSIPTWSVDRDRINPLWSLMPNKQTVLCHLSKKTPNTRVHQGPFLKRECKQLLVIMTQRDFRELHLGPKNHFYKQNMKKIGLTEKLFAKLRHLYKRIF